MPYTNVYGVLVRNTYVQLGFVRFSRIWRIAKSRKLFVFNCWRRITGYYVVATQVAPATGRLGAWALTPATGIAVLSGLRYPGGMGVLKGITIKFPEATVRPSKQEGSRDRTKCRRLGS